MFLSFFTDILFWYKVYFYKSKRKKKSLFILFSYSLNDFCFSLFWYYLIKNLKCLNLLIIFANSSIKYRNYKRLKIFLTIPNYACFLFLLISVLTLSKILVDNFRYILVFISVNRPLIAYLIVKLYFKSFSSFNILN